MNKMFNPNFDISPEGFVHEDDLSPEALERSHEEFAEAALAKRLKSQERSQVDDSELAVDMFMKKIEKAESVFEVDRILSVAIDDHQNKLLSDNQFSSIEARANAKKYSLSYAKRILGYGWLPYKD